MSLADGFGEQNLEDVVSVLVRLVEAAGAAIIFVGAVIAFVRFLRIVFRPEGMDPFAQMRLNGGDSGHPDGAQLLPRPGDQGGDRARPSG